MRKTDFEPYKVGRVFNPFQGHISKLNEKLKKIKIKYPSRLDSMAIDPSKIATNDNLKYTPGQVDFKLSLVAILLGSMPIASSLLGYFIFIFFSFSLSLEI